MTEIHTTLDLYGLNNGIIGEVLGNSPNLVDQKLAKSIENYTGKLGAVGRPRLRAQLRG